MEIGSREGIVLNHILGNEVRQMVEVSVEESFANSDHNSVSFKWKKISLDLE